MVDLRVAVHKTGQQLLAFEIAGDEIERGEAEGSLEDQVVEGDETDLGLGIGGVGEQLLMGLDQSDVEDRPKGRRDLLSSTLDVGGDRGRVGDHLVLEASVELHVARLIDLLGRQEGRLLLAAVGADQPGELGGDPLLGDHQRGQDPEDQAPVLLAQALPLLFVSGEVDRKRRPLALLPMDDRESEGRRGASRSWRHRLAGADDRRGGLLVNAMGLGDLDLLESGGDQRGLELAPGQGAGDAAGPLRPCRPGSPRPCPRLPPHRRPRSARRASEPARPRQAPWACRRRG